ncbi:hypothetical protein OBBRIDRAFT_803474 [Obba rivulosa]|uniref:Uncharacterized protein n=1 Tax=Obba rivulosa TaxID=1052685 RepID=A0A8E2AV53_9APHY|nr:hypothetical protein OBBRIDRAFT_803474 [Obba rivulosa]
MGGGAVLGEEENGSNPGSPSSPYITSHTTSLFPRPSYIMTVRKSRGALQSGNIRRRRLPGGSEANYPQWGQRGLVTPPPAERVYDTVMDFGPSQPDPTQLAPTAALSLTTSVAVNAHYPQSTTATQEQHGQIAPQRRPRVPHSVNQSAVSELPARVILATHDPSFGLCLPDERAQSIMLSDAQSVPWNNYQSQARFGGADRAPAMATSSGSNCQGSRLQRPAIPYWSPPVQPGTAASNTSGSMSFPPTPIVSPALSSDSGLSRWSTPSSASHGRRSCRVRDIVPIDATVSTPAPAYPSPYIPSALVNSGYGRPDYGRIYSMSPNSPLAPMNSPTLVYDRSFDRTEGVGSTGGDYARSSHTARSDTELTAPSVNVASGHIHDFASEYFSPSTNIPQQSSGYFSTGTSTVASGPGPVELHGPFALDQGGIELASSDAEIQGSFNGAYQALGSEAPQTIESIFELEFGDGYDDPAMQTISQDEWNYFVAYLNNMEATRTLGHDQYMQN